MLDGMLGYPAKLYDGSWIEWGQMATSDKSGALTPASTWRTDTAARTENLTYNVDATPTPFVVDVIAGANSTAANANEVNTTDAAVCN